MLFHRAVIETQTLVRIELKRFYQLPFSHRLLYILWEYSGKLLWKKV